jgi:hypothetical protein
MRLSDDYWNDPHSQELRREVLKNDRDCMMTRQQNALDESGGGFAKINPTTVTGQTPPEYPRQPAGSPWSQPDRNVEPPFDTDISYVEPVLQTANPTTEVTATLPVGSVERQEGEGDHSTSPSTNSDAATAPFAYPSGVAVSAKGGNRNTPPVSSRKHWRRF